MSKIASLSIACLSLLAAPLALYAADEPLVLNRNKIPLTAKPGSSGKQLSSAALWITSDDGTTWQRYQQLDANEKGHVALVFRPPADGRFGFATVRQFTDGSSDQQPQAGQAPLAKLVVVIDRRPPRIREHAFARSTDGAVNVTWETQDANPTAQPIQIEGADLDEDNWQAIGPAQPSSGKWTIPAASHGRYRITAVDRAGNRSYLQPWIATPTEPEPADTVTENEATTELVEAIADLPDPEQIADDADTEAAASPENDATVAAATASTEPAAEVTTVTPEPVAPPAPPMPTIQELAPLPAIVPADVVVNSSVEPESVPSGRLFGSDAEQALAAARNAATSQRLGEAIALYRRLADSQLSAIALSEEVLALAAHGQRGLALTRIRNAPIDAKSPRLALISATLALHDADFIAAEAATADIPIDGPLHRQSLWLSSLAAFGQHRFDEARATMRHISAGTDLMAHHAQILINAKLKPAQ